MRVRVLLSLSLSLSLSQRSRSRTTLIGSPLNTKRRAAVTAIHATASQRPQQLRLLGRFVRRYTARDMSGPARPDGRCW